MPQKKPWEEVYEAPAIQSQRNPWEQQYASTAPEYRSPEPPLGAAPDIMPKTFSEAVRAIASPSTVISKLMTSPPTVASEQAANVLRGIPQLVTGIPDMVGAVGEGITSMHNPRQILDLTKRIGTGVVQPAIPVVKSLMGNALPPESPEWVQAARGAGMMLAGMELPNVVRSPLAQQVAQRLPRIPTRAHAGQLFEQVENLAPDVTPSELAGARRAAEGGRQLTQYGYGPTPDVLERFLQGREQAIDILGNELPMPFREARARGSAASGLSVMERLATRPRMGRQAAMFADEMRQAQRAAATRGGPGVAETFEQAMREYAQAQRLRRLAQIGAGAGAGYVIGRKAMKLGEQILPQALGLFAP